jgi:hypothetical protein
LAKLKDRIKFALDEGRMLILGSQVLVGFQFRSILEKGFEQLPRSSQYLKLGALGLMLLAIGLLMSPGAYHRIVDEGEDTRDTHGYTTRVLSFALLPFAVAFGLDMYIVAGKLMGRTQSILAGAGVSLVSLFFWYGLEMMRRAERAPEIKEVEEMEEKKKKEEGGTKVKDKIEQALTEARVVLPGAQALLGFQFASMLVEGFDKLPGSSKYVHLLSLALMVLAVILLMAPAAYHRIVEEGQDTEHFHRVASRLLIASMIPLALGICGDVFVVVRKVTESGTAGLISAAAMLIFFYGLWFGYTIYKRGERAGGSKDATRRQKQAGMMKAEG